MLECNTYIRYGFADGCLEHVPDPESEQNLKKTTPSAIFDLPAEHKRKRASTDNAADFKNKANKGHNLVLTTKVKWPRISKTVPPNVSFTTAGCTWSAEDWSCAYDVAIMTMLMTYRSFSTEQKAIWAEETRLNHVLSVSFDHLLSSPHQLLSHSAYNEIRDHLRDHLSLRDPQKFPRRGRLGAPAALIFEYLTKEINPTLSVVYTCRSLPSCEPPVNIPTESNPFLLLSHAHWQRWNSRSATNLVPEHASVQTWLNLALEWRAYRLGPATWTCSGCNLVRSSCIFIDLLPSFLAIEVSPDTPQPSVTPCNELILPGQHQMHTYSLTGVIYLGDFHFTV